MAGVHTSTDFQLAPGHGPGELLVVLERTDHRCDRQRPAQSAHAEGGAHGDGQVSIVAPMPGRVVRVLVAPGDEVEARQGVVVVEAMKMENELRAPRAGRVKEISVRRWDVGRSRSHPCSNRVAAALAGAPAHCAIRMDTKPDHEAERRGAAPKDTPRRRSDRAGRRVPRVVVRLGGGAAGDRRGAARSPR